MSYFISDAWAQAAPAPAGAGWEGLIFPIAIVVIFWFFLIRPQQKKAKEHRAMVESLSKGDEVVSSGGLLGKIVEIDESFVSLEVAAGVRVRVQRHAVAALMPKGTFKGGPDK
jgi:preprotein translocase subunit YajC